MIGISILAVAWGFSASTHSEDLSSLELNFEENGLEISAPKVYDVCLMML
ncbi:hypothetical protein V4B17_01775 [Bartonella sp. B23]